MESYIIGHPMRWGAFAFGFVKGMLVGVCHICLLHSAILAAMAQLLIWDVMSRGVIFRHVYCSL
jgi:hypothetical protein